MINILYAFGILSVLGLLLGIGLSFAEKKLSVKKDERLEELEAMMPGANCGGCGFAGCSAYAEAVNNGTALPGLCQPGGEELSRKMSAVVGVKAEKKERMVAFVFCSGNSEVTKKAFEYDGSGDCNALSLLFGGDNECKEGCLRLGSCMKVCPVEAIGRKEDGSIVVDKDKCIGCGSCTRVCPKGTIQLVPYSAEYLVACSNHQSGAKAKKACSKACIGCKICETKVDSSPFVVENFLSSNDLSKNQENAHIACEKCPQKCIVRT